MISNKTLFHITQVLPRCSVGHSAGDILIVDSNAEALGELNFENPGVIVYKGYSHTGKVVRRLKKAGIPVELREQNPIETATKIIYNN